MAPHTYQRSHSTHDQILFNIKTTLIIEKYNYNWERWEIAKPEGSGGF